DDLLESELPPHNRLCLFALGSRYEIGESSTARPTGGRRVDPIEAVLEIAPMTVGEVNTRVTELAELHEHDTQDLYALLEDAQDSRTRISQRETVLIVDEEAYASREAWAHTIGLSQAIHYEFQTHHEQVYAHESQLHAHQTQLQLQGTEGVVGLTQWIEKMGSVFNISGCVIENQVKFATCTLLGAALTWWNGQIRSLGPEHMQVLREVKGNDVPTYIERFQELTLICTKFVANETEKVDKYISGLPDNTIYGKVKNAAKVYNIGTGKRKPYGGSLPKCTKCHLYHNGPCTQRCHKCNKVGHFARDYRSTGNTNVANTQKGNGAAPKGNGCFECGAPGHFKRDCPKLKNKDGGNGNAQGWVYAVGNAKKRGNASGNPDANVITNICQEEEDKSEGKQINDIPIIRDFPEVFPEDLPGLPLA
ncbi:putative reverse transcriptase domain-containing protein, partial [Tanacetum coccineum]